VEVRADRVEAKVVDGRLTGAAATGGVTVRRGSWNGSAGRAELDAVGATLRLTDGVDVVEPGRRLEAARVTVWLDEERVDCDACRVRFDSAP
jgi:lipopolysaccharide export system protein LptA